MRTFPTHPQQPRYIVATALAALVVILLPIHVAAQTSNDELQRLVEFYLDQLDDWTEVGDMTQVKANVVEPCGKMILLAADRDKQVKYLRDNASRFDQKVELCTAMTLHRLERRAELTAAYEAGDLAELCEIGPVWSELCARAGLAP